MSIISEVVQAVTERGTATLDDLERAMPHIPRKQLRNALKNARTDRRLRVKVRGNSRSGRASVWEPGAKMPQRSTRAKPEPGPASVVPSAFHAADPVEFDVWPPLAAGTVYAPLGEWNEPKPESRRG